MKKAVLLAGFLFFLGGFMAQAQAQKEMESKSMTEQRKAQETVAKTKASLEAYKDLNYFLNEDFESGMFPPDGWSTIDFHSNPTSNWSLAVDDFGNSYAEVLYNDVNLMDEWLISPSLDLTSMTDGFITFQFMGSYHWMVTEAGADIMLKVSTDGGLSWTQIWVEEDFGTFVNWEWNVVTLPFTYTGLPDVKIAFHFFGDDGAQLGIDDVGIYSVATDDPPSCVTYLTPLDAAENIVLNPNLSWQSSMVATGYELFLGETLPATGIDLGSATNYEASLEYSTTYQWQVVPYNSFGNAVDCPVWTFTTMADPLLFPPFTQDFNTTPFPPLNWTRWTGILSDDTQLTTSTSGWFHHSFGNTGGANNAAYVNMYGTRNHWLITPPIELGMGVDYRLTFDIALTPWTGTAQSTLGPDDYLAVVISTDMGQTWSDANVLISWDETDLILPTGQQVIIPLTGYTGTVMFGFYAERPTGNIPDLRFYVDNVTVEEVPEEAIFVVSPQSWDFENVEPGFQSLTQYFTISNGGVGTLLVDAPVLNNLTDFMLEYDAADFPASLTSGQTVTFGVTFTPQTEGLKEGQLTISYNDGTAGTAIVNLTGTGAFRPEGSTCNNPFMATLPIVDYQGSTEEYGDDYSSDWVEPATSYLNGNDFVFQFTLADAGLLSGSVAGSWAGLVIVAECPNPDNPPARLALASGSTGGAFADIYLEAGTYYGIVSSWPSPQTTEFTLNLSFGLPPTCPEPTDLTVSEITTSSAILGWTEAGEATSWNIEWGVAGFTLGSGTLIPGADNPYMLDGLVSSTAYGFYVQAICDGEVSEWVGPMTFTTLFEPGPGLLFYQSVFDGGSATTSAYNPDAGIDFEAAENFFGVEDQIEEFVFYGLALLFVEGVGWVEQTPESTEPFFVKFYDYQEEENPVVAPVTGNYQIALIDSYGDGWNGGIVSVYVEGIEVLTDLTLVDGSGPEYHSFTATAGDLITTVYTAGSWSAENYYAILDPADNIIAEDGGTWTDPEQSTPTGLGGTEVLEPDWANPLSSQTLNATVENVGTVWDGDYMLYKFTVELSTPMNMEQGWISAQIDATTGSGTYFLWINSLDGDLLSWQRAPATKGGSTREIAQLASLSKVNPLGESRAMNAYDLAMELWGAETVEPEFYTLTISIIGEGDVMVNDILYTEPLIIEEGTEVTVEAIPAIGWEFSGWTGDVVSPNPEETFMMDQDYHKIANFTEEIVEPEFYTLTISIVGDGVVEVDNILYTVPVTVEEGTVLTLEAIAAMDWNFAGWSGDIVSGMEIMDVTMDQDYNLVATFTEEVVELYMLELLVNPAGAGSVTGGGLFEAGESVMVSAFANVGYQFVNWTMNGEVVSTNPGFAYIMPAMSVTLVANFQEVTPGDLIVTVDVTGVSCPGGDDGTINVSVTGGQKPYNICINYGCEIPGMPDKSAQTAYYTGLIGGYWQLTIVDANGVTYEECILVPEPEPLHAVVDIDPILCPGEGYLATATVTIYGGTMPYTFDGEVIEGNVVILSDLMAGEYTFEIIDANQCPPYNGTFEILIPDPIVVELDYDPIQCYDGTTFVDVIASGGTGILSLYNVVGEEYVFVSTLPLAAPIELGAGTYNWVVMDENECIFPINFTLVEPPMLQAVVVDYDDPTCYMGADGWAVIEISGGTPPYTSTLGEVVGNIVTIADLSAGVYTAHIDDAKNCGPLPVTFELEDPDPIVVDFEVTDLTCYGMPTGTIEVIAMGGNAPYEYSLDGVAWQASPLFTDLLAGIYTVYVMDADGCMEMLEGVEILQPDELIVELDISDVTCYGADDGQITGYITGGTGPYNICLLTYCTDDPFNGDFDPDKSQGFSHWGLTPGEYMIVVVDQNGCYWYECVTINEPDPVVAVIDEWIDVACYGEATGEATVSVYGGTGGYDFLWSDGQTTQTAIGLVAGIYSVTVTDEQGCIAIAEVTISQPEEPFIVEVEFGGVSCYGDEDGYIILTPQGGAGEYSVSGDIDALFVQGLTAGTYEFIITDALGCEIIQTVVITEPDMLTVDLVVEELVCEGDGEQAFVSDWVWYRQGLTAAGNAVDPDRSDPDQVIGEPFYADVAGTFFSLGFGGEMIVKFDAPFVNGTGDDLLIVETSFGAPSCSNYPEKVQVWVAQYINEALYTPVQGVVDVLNLGDTWYYLGEYCLDSYVELGELPWAQYVYMKDVSNQADFSSGSDGFDINGLVALHGLLTATADVNALPSGGTAPYTYLWNTGATTQKIEDVGPGTYSVEVTDAMGCVVFGDITVECYEVDVPEPIQSAIGDQLIVGDDFFTISAYPNPFAHQATIEFSMIQQGYVTLEIYNILGERVSVLFQGFVEANTTQQVTLKGDNLQKGMYFYKVTTGNNTYLERIILAK